MVRPRPDGRDRYGARAPSCSVARANIYICVIGEKRNLVGMSGLICIQPRLDKWRARALCRDLNYPNIFFFYFFLSQGAFVVWRVSTLTCLVDHVIYRQ